MNRFILFLSLVVIVGSVQAQRRKSNPTPKPVEESLFHGLKWRNIGPFRGGRSVASTGVVSDPMTYYFGSTGGGVWKTTDAGITWKNISDGFFESGTVGAIAVSESDPNVIFVGMGEHAVRGVMTSYGDGVYKSTDAGKTWKHVGLDKTMHISDVIIHPSDPDVVYVAAQGAQHGPTQDRGIYKTVDGGITWRKVHYVNEYTGASSLSMDMNNPRVLYASTWDHLRYPWQMRSGGPGSGLYKSVDNGETWEEMKDGLPKEFGKSGISVSRANSDVIYAVIEADGDKGGVYKSTDAGKSWKQVNKDRINIARSWYYMEIFADPQDENVVYVANAPVTKSIDGGRTFTPIPTPHGDNHHIWINPNDNQNMINSNDGGGNVTFNGGKSWSSQQFQPTAQFYRVITDNRVPYYVYGGQQDNSAIAIASRTRGRGIGWKDWYSVAGCESAYLAFDEDNPDIVFGGCYQGIIERWQMNNGESKPLNEYPELSLGNAPSTFKYRYNWNAPIVTSPFDVSTIYHTGNVVFKTTDMGQSWDVISPDLTRNNKEQQVPGGAPYTNEAAGGENYNTIMYFVESPHEQGVLWVGTDDGLVHISKDGGTSWQNVTPSGMPEGIVNSIEVSPHDAASAYITLMRYKFNDLKPYVYKTSDYGNSWTPISDGFDKTFPRVVREDKVQKGLLYAGTEHGMYISFNDGSNWQAFKLNLPVVPINDLTIRQNDLVAATAGRSFWVLDDLAAIQQSKGSFSGVALYKPKDTYRLFGGSSDQPVPGWGQNPKTGVTFDYYLPEDMDSTEIKVLILEGDEIIRTYTNQSDEDFRSWPGGPPKPAVLGSKKGINRFTWDFRRETLPAVDGVFAFGDYRGSPVGPGTYGIHLVTENDSLQTEVTILADPSVDASSSDYREQVAFMTDLEDKIRTLHQSVSDVRSAKAQLDGYSDLLAENEDAKVLVDTAKSIIKRIDEWEKNWIQPRQKTFQDVINFNNKLNAQLMFLKQFVDAADPKLTEGAKQRKEDLESVWQEFVSSRDQLIEVDFANFNKMYQELELPAVILKD
jgi:photosystem II stability/assembly factor-like uncharacterized protein